MTKRNSPVVHITREEFQALIREEDERLKVRAEDVLKLRRSRDCIFSEDGSAVLLRISTPWDKEFGAYIVLDSPDLEIVIKLNISGRLVGYKKLRAYLSGAASQSLEKLLLGIDDPEVRTGHFNGDLLDFRRANLYVYRSNPNPNVTISYGHSWPRVRLEALERSGGICERCHKTPVVNVHHRLPVRFFADPNDANFLENLIAVCKKCHRKEHDEIRKNLPLFNEMLRSWRMR